MKKLSKKPLQNSYALTLEKIKKQIRESRHKAALAVNSEMIILYWKIGKEILEKQKEAKWGDKVLEKFSDDLLEEFPDMRGFSKRNIFYMRQFAEFYPDFLIVQQAAAQIPWFHNVAIMQAVSEAKEREFYIKETIANGWSRNVLEMQIQSRLFHRKGKTINNFSRTLSSEQSDLVNQTFKDPYIFDFLTISDEASERQIEEELSTQVTKFLLELGKGFSFMGRQVHLDVGDEDYYMDLLFYHVHLKSYVVVELKATKFKPEYAGKLNFYLAVVDDKIKRHDDKTSIGILLCNGKNGLTAEYALKNTTNPIGIASYKTTEKLPKTLQNQLPTIAEIEKGLSKKFKNNLRNVGNKKINSKTIHTKRSRIALPTSRKRRSR